MDNHISSTCRFCLGDREEFHHLARDCPALWWERHTINAQEPSRPTPELWSPQQILDFTMFPKINEAFAKPLFYISTPDTNMNKDDPDPQPRVHSSDSESSLMEISSETDSSTASYNSRESLISIE